MGRSAARVPSPTILYPKNHQATQVDLPQQV
ncbi:unnamed protein product, partial [Rotaria sp. Silwood2]